MQLVVDLHNVTQSSMLVMVVVVKIATSSLEPTDRNNGSITVTGTFTPEDVINKVKHTRDTVRISARKVILALKTTWCRLDYQRYNCFMEKQLGTQNITYESLTNLRLESLMVR